MGRPRQYATDAERQRAFRQRQEQERIWVPRGALEGLHAQLERLQQALWSAADRGDPMAQSCQAASWETMLEKLTRHFEASSGSRAAARAERSATSPGEEPSPAAAVGGS